MDGDQAADDLQLSVKEIEGETVVSVVLDRTADYCYRAFSSAEEIPKWLMVVGRAVVRAQDPRGRALEVDFTGTLERASVAYTLTYHYNDVTREVTWHRQGGGGGVKELAGSARFIPEGMTRCRLRYALRTELASSLPPWDDGLYESRPAEAVVLDFCEWLEQRER